MNILNKIFDKVFLITSPITYNDRLSNIKSLQKEIDCEIVVATHIDNLKENEKLNRQNCSLNYAYFSIFINALINNYNSICTIEDDLYKTSDYAEKLEEYMKDVDSDWEILNLGYHYHGSLTVNDEVKDVSDQSVKDYEETITFHKIVQPEAIIGTHIMGFKKSVYTPILNLLKDNNLPIDWFLYKNGFYYVYKSYQLRKKLFLGKSFREQEVDSKLEHKEYISSLESK